MLNRIAGRGAQTLILHNPRCSKSRDALKLLQNRKEDVQVIEYLKKGLTAEELTEVSQLLEMSPPDFMRKGEKLFKEKYAGKDFSCSEWIAAIVDHPILMERPIVIKGSTAAIGRPIENIITILEAGNKRGKRAPGDGNKELENEKDEAPKKKLKRGSIE